MSKILYNPENGATIKDMVVGSVGYFNDSPFNPGDFVKIEDEQAADTIMDTFGFLEEVTIEQAKSIKDKKEKNTLRCDECDFTTDDQKKLTGHKLHHAKEDKIDKELGIKVVKGLKQDKKQVNPDEMQSIIDAEATSDGLIGEGLTRDK